MSSAFGEVRSGHFHAGVDIPGGEPEGAGSAEGIEWYAALTDPDITTVIGGLGRFTFGWEL